MKTNKQFIRMLFTMILICLVVIYIIGCGYINILLPLILLTGLSIALGYDLKK